MSTASVPHVVRAVWQQDHHDCAVAATAMLCGVDYPTALAAFSRPAQVLREGVSPWAEFRRACRRLGVQTRVKRRPDLERDTGILYLTDDEHGHVCLLWEGRIVDGDGMLWLFVVDYLQHRGMTAHTLLERV